MSVDRLYLQHMRDAVLKIEQYLGGLSFETFENNTQIVDAVIREVEIIGEAAKHVSEQFQKEHHEWQWNDMISMRNRLIHEYFDVDTAAVWDTSKVDLPILLQRINDTLEQS